MWRKSSKRQYLGKLILTTYRIIFTPGISDDDPGPPINIESRQVEGIAALVCFSHQKVILKTDHEFAFFHHENRLCVTHGVSSSLIVSPLCHIKSVLFLAINPHFSRPVNHFWGRNCCWWFVLGLYRLQYVFVIYNIYHVCRKRLFWIFWSLNMNLQIRFLWIVKIIDLSSLK